MTLIRDYYPIVKGSGLNSVQQKETSAEGSNSSSFGHTTVAKGDHSQAEGFNTFAIGAQSHAEGAGSETLSSFTITSVSGNTYYTSGNHGLKIGQIIKYNKYYRVITAIPSVTSFTLESPISIPTGNKVYIVSGCSYGMKSHVEGENNVAKGNCSHAEGTNNIAYGNDSHVEGYNTKTQANKSHAEGYGTIASEEGAHAEGHASSSNSNYLIIASGKGSHAEGFNAPGATFIASGKGSHAEGINEGAGFSIEASGDGSHAEGSSTKAKKTASHSEGYVTISDGIGAHAEGVSTKTTSKASHAEGIGTIAGSGTRPSDNPNLDDYEAAHAEGHFSFAEGTASHAENEHTYAKGNSSHSEGWNTEAKGDYSHAEGRGCVAEGSPSHAEGQYTQALGHESHSEGSGSIARGIGSHSEGIYTVAENIGEHAEGKYNKSNTNTIHSVGIGTADNDRKNAFEILSNGNAYLYGIGEYDGTNPTSNGTLSLQDIIKGLKLNVVCDTTQNTIYVDTHIFTMITKYWDLNSNILLNIEDTLTDIRCQEKIIALGYDDGIRKAYSTKNYTVRETID